MELAIDLECENNLHHYGVFISLIQISSSSKNWIIDVLKFKALTPLKDVLENKNILKVFHDVSFDFRILNYQLNIHPQNVFDTQMAALLLGKEMLGLSSLLEEYFGIKKDSRFQKIDWCRRPLSPQMLEYAVKDTAYLLRLKQKLEEDLFKLNRSSWLKEECAAVDKVEFTYGPQTYLDPRELALLHALFDLRENTAKRINRPAFMMMGNKILMGLVASPITDVGAFRNLPGVHPMVRAEAKTWIDTIKKALSGPGENYVSHYKKLTPEQFQKKEEFIELRNKKAKEMGLRGHILASEEQIIECVVNGTSSPLKDWQREVLKKELLKLGLK
ncbi:HRDC domain-containing protein [Candidatus Woesearchaeota archaeon]|nr:HRDC domain-containing protein [Candidatus Woesearchaeota archaeon]